MFKKFFVSGIFILLLTIFFNNSAQAVWRLDGTDEKNLPRNFRTMTDAWHMEIYFDDGNRAGLEKLQLHYSIDL